MDDSARPSNKGRRFIRPDTGVKLKFLFGIGLLALLILTFGCKGTGRDHDKPLSLGYFKNIYDLSLSSDGNQLIFSASGHKEYGDETIYRYEINSGKLFRYIPQGKVFIAGGRFSPGSSRFVFKVIPYDSNDKNVYEDMQIAIANHDGSGYRKLTQGKGVKLHPAISRDEKTLVYFKGRILESKSRFVRQKKKAGGMDLFKVDLFSGKETKLTRLEFHEVSDPYFSIDGEGVVFSAYAPMRLPDSENLDDVWRFRDRYKLIHDENLILRYSLDGSGIDLEPMPYFTHKTGSKDPVITEEGSLWFEGRIGAQGWIHYYRKLPSGKLTEIEYNSLGIGANGKSLYKFVTAHDGSKLAALTWYQNTKEKFIRILDTKTKKSYELSIPASAVNIYLK